jgi:biopolymer transport protein ExbD
VKAVARRGSSKGNVSADINVTPMADIMLVLLIIFMITTPLLQEGVTVNLPDAKNPLEDKEMGSEKAIVVALNRDGRLYLKKQLIDDAELNDYLVKRYAGGEINRTIYLRADETLNYGRVVQVVDLCRTAGVDRIGLVAELEKE